MISATNIEQEKNFFVTARDGKDIFVSYAKAKNNADNKAIILAHGITGCPEEYIHMHARNFFTSNGYDVYRMSFYDDADNARKMHTTTLPLQANDLNDVVEHVNDNHNKVFVCGHSYGGATTLFANPKTTANAFWDSSFDVTRFWQGVERHTETIDKKSLVTSQRIAMLFSEDMRKHAYEQSEQDMENLSKSISSPSVVITAGADILVESGKHLYEHLTCDKDYAEIKNADHCFINGDTAQDLYKVTLNWFERF